MQDDQGGRRDLGRRLLSLDGGHTDEMGSLSQLFTLGEIMSRMGHDLQGSDLRPCKWFDMICGSGTGGLIAILLGKMEMTVEEAIKAYIELFPNVYSEAKGKGPAEEDKTKQLENGLETLMSQRLSGGSQERLMLQEPGKCKVFVCTMTSDNLAFPVLFRTYSVRSNKIFNCSVKEAALAVTAFAEEYRPVMIGGTIKQPFIAASHCFNNPTDLLLREAKETFPDQSVSCIVSIGTGHPGVTQITSFNPLAKAVLQLSLDCEKAAQDASRQFGCIPGLYFRLNVEQGMQWRLLNGSEASAEVAAHTHSYLSSPLIDKKIDNLVESLHKRTPRATIKDLGDIVKPVNRARKLCPPPSANFTGRQKELSQLNEYFDSSGGRHIHVLHGLGGSGKTQLVSKFVEEAQLRDPPRFAEVFFVDGTSKETIEDELKAIAQEKHAGDFVDAALNCLARGQRDWLIVFDNADDNNIRLSQYFPQCSFGNILITTRNPARATLAPSGASIEVDDLEQDDAVQLLLRAARCNVSDVMLGQAADIVKELHYFALAVTQAGAYIFNCCGLPEYLQIYRKRRDWLHSNHHGEDPEMYDRGVYTTGSLSVQKLSPVALQLLQLCSFIHYQGIRRQFFERAVMNSLESDVLDPDNLAQSFLRNFIEDGDLWDVTKFLPVVREIESYSLLQYDSANDYYNIHPLVQTCCQTLTGIAKPVQCMTTILALSVLFPGEHDFIFCGSLVPHLDEIRLHSNGLQDQIAIGFYRVYDKAGRWTDCEELMKPVVEARKELLGDQHPDTLLSIANLATTFRNQGRWKEAEELDVAVMETRKRLLGEEHPNTLLSLANLASTFWNQGRWKEAEELDVAVMEARNRLLGEEHPSTISSMANLAATFQDQGRWNEAEELKVSVLEARKRLLGEEHPDTLTSMANLAVTFSNQGRWKEAQELKVSVLEARKRLLGGEHPDTLSSMANLAATFRNQGRWNEAEELKVSVLEARKRLLGEEHPDTLSSMANLAATFSDQGRWKEAEELEVAVVEARKRLLGQEHPDTLLSMADLAATFSDQGRWNEAEKLGVAVVEARKRLLGQEHPDTLLSMANLAATFSNQGRWNEAEELKVSVLEARKRLLGQEHPDTLSSMANLAVTFGDQGRWKEAEELELAVVEASTWLLGKEHPDTLLAMANLAVTFSNQGRWKEAEELKVAVVEVRKRLLGEEHPHTLTSIAYLASTFWNQGRWKEAEELDVAVMEARKRLLGEEHLDTLLSMANLAVTYGNQDRWKEAEELEVSVLEARKRLLGKEHPSTILSMANLAATFSNQGRWNEAEELEVAVVEARKRLFGDEHPDTLCAMHNLGRTYFDQGRNREAKELLIATVENRVRVLGESHPDTLESIRSLKALEEDRDSNSLGQEEARRSPNRSRKVREWIDSKQNQLRGLHKRVARVFKE